MIGYMVSVYRSDGLRIVIFTDDHKPAHVHVFGDGEAKIDLVGIDGLPQLVWAEGMKRSDMSRAMRLVAEQRDSLLLRWRQLHG